MQIIGFNDLMEKDRKISEAAEAARKGKNSSEHMTFYYYYYYYYY